MNLVYQAREQNKALHQHQALPLITWRQVAVSGHSQPSAEIHHAIPPSRHYHLARADQKCCHGTADCPMGRTDEGGLQETEEAHGAVRYAHKLDEGGAFTFPVEVRCRGFTGTSTQQLLKTLGVTNPNSKGSLQDLMEEVDQRSF